MNVGGLTLRPQFPITKKIYLNGEAGLGIVTRHGFDAADGTPIIKGVTYPTVLLGGGINYHLNDSWRLMLSGAYTPDKKSVNQPATTFIAAGFNYKLKTISDRKLQEAAKTGYIHPKQWLQIGYSSNALGYGINNALEKVSLFWGGDVEVLQGLTLNYQRNIYHAAKVFALDWGISASSWQTKGVGSALNNPDKQNFVTLSVYPVLRFNIIHSKPMDAYFYYSVAGPTYISKTDFQIQNKFGVNETALTGKHFTFQDNIGLGAFFGKNRNYNAEIKIGHYSNGNVFPVNAAVKVPLSLNIGYAF
jgi:Lipid A 3-O-deacylase (PagL).